MPRSVTIPDATATQSGVFAPVGAASGHLGPIEVKAVLAWPVASLASKPAICRSSSAWVAYMDNTKNLGGMGFTAVMSGGSQTSFITSASVPTSFAGDLFLRWTYTPSIAGAGQCVFGYGFDGFNWNTVETVSAAGGIRHHDHGDFAFGTTLFLPSSGGSRLKGKLHHLQVAAGSGGTRFADFDPDRFRALGFGQSVTMASSDIWTITGSAFVSGDVPVSSVSPTYALQFYPGTDPSTQSPTDITSWVNRFDIDRRLATVFDTLTEGRCTIELFNDTGRFTQNNSVGAYYPDFRIGKLMRVRAARFAELSANDAASAALVSSNYLSSVGSGWVSVRADTGRRVGRWYFEGKAPDYLNNTASTALAIGLAPITALVDGQFSVDSGAFAWITGSQHVAIHAEGSMVRSFAATVNSASVFGVAWNTSSAGVGITFLHNNSAYFTVNSGYQTKINSTSLHPAFGVMRGGAITTPSLQAIFALSSLTYAPPLGYDPIEPAYDLFTGRIKNIENFPSIDKKTVILELKDSIARLSNAIITTSFFIDSNPADIFVAIASQCQVNSFSSGIFGDSIPYAWFREVPASKALNDLIVSGRNSLFEDGAGTLQFKSRFYSIDGTTQNSLATHSNPPLAYSHLLTDSLIINRAKIEAQTRKASTSQQTVAFVVAPIAIPASGAVGFWLSYVDPVDQSVGVPVMSLATPVSSADWLVWTGSAGTGTNLTASTSLNVTFFGQTAVATLFNTSSRAGYITKFQVKGYPLQLQPTITVETNDASSQAVYGRFEFALTSDMLGSFESVKDYAERVIADRKEVQASIGVERKNTFPQNLSWDLADVLSVVDSLSAANDQFVIKGINHAVNLQVGLEHTTRYELMPSNESPWLVLDHPSFGLIDAGRVLA